MIYAISSCWDIKYKLSIFQSLVFIDITLHHYGYTFTNVVLISLILLRLSCTNKFKITYYTITSCLSNVLSMNHRKMHCRLKLKKNLISSSQRFQTLGNCLSQINLTPYKTQLNTFFWSFYPTLMKWLVITM